MSNIGVGVSTQVGIFHMYGLVDNIFNMTNLAKAKSASVQFGFNLIFD